MQPFLLFRLIAGSRAPSLAGKIMPRSEKVQPEDDAEAVLKTLEESGAFDELRQQLLTQVKANVSFEGWKLYQDFPNNYFQCEHALPFFSRDKRERRQSHNMHLNAEHCGARGYNRHGPGRILLSEGPQFKSR